MSCSCHNKLHVEMHRVKAGGGPVPVMAPGRRKRTVWMVTLFVLTAKPTQSSEGIPAGDLGAPDTWLLHLPSPDLLSTFRNLFPSPSCWHVKTFIPLKTLNLGVASMNQIVRRNLIAEIDNDLLNFFFIFISHYTRGEGGWWWRHWDQKLEYW